MTTIEINLDTITCKDAWILVKKHEAKEIDINLTTLLSSKLASILSQDPENVQSHLVNGFTIETTDCYKKHYIRVVDLDTNWIVYRDLNTWRSELSWEPECIEFEAQENNYILNTESFKLFKLVKL